MKRHFRYRPKAPPRPQSPSKLYEYYKIVWSASHPEATPEEYSAALQRLAKLAGA